MPSDEGPRRPKFEVAWRERFEHFATLRDDDAGIAGWSASGLEARFRRFLKVWHRSEHGGSWLDAGCGAGTYTRFLADQGAQVLGLDYSWPTIVKARARDKGRCTWGVADVTQLPLRAGGFDGVICFGVMQALADSGPAIRELVGQVRPGGEVWVDALNGYCLANVMQRLSRWLRGRRAHLRYESPYRMRRLMRESGLVKVRIHWIPILPSKFKAFQRLAERDAIALLLRFIPGLGPLLSHSCMLTGAKPAFDARPSGNI